MELFFSGISVDLCGRIYIYIYTKKDKSKMQAHVQSGIKWK